MEKNNQNFIKKGIIILILFLVILTILNLFYINIIEKNKQIFRKESEWQVFKDTIPNKTLDYAFFGDSHARDGLNPEYINNSFNFASSREDYIETYFKIIKLLEQDDLKIRKLILEIDPHAFSNKLRTREGLFNELSFYSSFINLDTISDLKGENILSLYIKDKFKIVGKGNEIVSYFFISSELTYLKNGWTKNTKDFSKTNKINSAASSYNTHFSKEPILNEYKSLTYFKKILNLAKEKKINVVFIKYPLSREYYLELKKHNIHLQEYYQKLFSEVNKITSGYQILDYQDLLSDNPEYFGDSDHLNYKGAEILSKLVAEDLEKASKFPSVNSKILK